MPYPHPRSGRPQADAAPALARRVERLRDIARAEPRLEGVLLYGSWTLGEADAYSDIEAYVFVRDEAADGFDGRAFLAQLAPLELAYTNMFGILAVVFDDLMRGEFHFEPASEGIPRMDSWQGMVHLPEPEAAVLLDRDGRLTEAASRLARPLAPEPRATAQRLADELANWTLMLAHVLGRGETARAHALLQTMVAPQQLQLCRLLRSSTEHWLTPSRALEADLPERDRRRHAATTGPAEPRAVRTAAVRSWEWSRELIAEAAGRWGTRVPGTLHDRIAALLASGRDGD
ncbi:nucleotidyltransferase domain-containing protein [Streptomyces sp. HNM0574]|uniref:nucleotidyltransferase domain-containing protein n=1 Tax=Streptomyces sp. HNM0574 TaxID=2714954 RepID=UPI00146CE4E1|nr:nucleotidyltransferase domain-containing protein [Streptomyces sp. HNM0574]NLU65889.1 nucleotidyltransferase domain-containing protein [Streptomyces sp. HNM0574]